MVRGRLSLFCLIQDLWVGGSHRETDAHSTHGFSQVWLAQVQGLPGEGWTPTEVWETAEAECREEEEGSGA